jgi:hypothetical protein
MPEITRISMIPKTMSTTKIMSTTKTMEAMTIVKILDMCERRTAPGMPVRRGHGTPG